MTPLRMHDDEVDISAGQVKALIGEQLPRCAHLQVTRIASGGTVNAIFRLGTELTARFPLRAEDPEEVALWLRREAQAAAELVEVSPVPVPRPVHLGSPGTGTRCHGRCRPGYRARPPPRSATPIPACWPAISPD